MSIHCLRCKTKTHTHQPMLAQTGNGRFKVNGICASCGHKKSRFVSKADVMSGQRGQGLLGNLLGLPGGKIPGLSQIPLLGNLLF